MAENCNLHPQAEMGTRQMGNVGFVCFGEVNTPFERLQIKHDAALKSLRTLAANFVDGGIVIDDPAYETADKAIALLKAEQFDSLILCVAGWVPTHAVIRVADEFRSLPMVLWGLCGWREGDRIVTTAEQAGTSALRPALEAMDYTFKYVYNVIDEPEPLEAIDTYIRAAFAAKRLRHARVGTMGYRDMLLYGTQYEGNSMRGQLGVEVEPFEMLEMVREAEALSAQEVAQVVSDMRSQWTILKPCADSVLEKGARYALALAKRVRERGYDAVTLIDVDGMKKLLGFPPGDCIYAAGALLRGLHHAGKRCDGQCNAANGALFDRAEWRIIWNTMSISKRRMLIGVPDYIPIPAIEGNVELLPTAFGLLDASLLNVSKVKTGYVTCARLYYKQGPVLYAYLHWRSQAAAQVGRIWLGASCAAAAKSGSLPRFLHGARVCAAGIQPARNCVLRERGAGAQRTVRPIGHCGGILTGSEEGGA